MAGKTLDVFYHEKIVGTLAEMPDKRIAFQYSEEWIRDGFAISPLSLPLKNTVFVPPEKSREYFGGLFGIFADSLPDRILRRTFGNGFPCTNLRLFNLYETGPGSH